MWADMPLDPGYLDVIDMEDATIVSDARQEEIRKGVARVVSRDAAGKGCPWGSSVAQGIGCPRPSARGHRTGRCLRARAVPESAAGAAPPQVYGPDRPANLPTQGDSEYFSKLWDPGSSAGIRKDGKLIGFLSVFKASGFRIPG